MPAHPTINNISFGMKKIYQILLLLLVSISGASAQEPSLLDELLANEPPSIDYATNAFKGTRVINAQSMEMLHPGTMDFRILHRFGKINQGAYQLFGLDQASMRMGFDFGITRNLMAGIGRSTFNKEVDGFIKYRLLWQSKGAKNVPFSLILLSGMSVNGLKDVTGNPEVPTTFNRRLGYYHALIIGRKFNERFTLQLTPTLVHTNIVASRVIPNDLYALGFGGRFKMTKRMALVWDYTYAFNRFPGKFQYNPLSLGIDIETGGHVFQLHFSNAVGMNERAFISDSNGDWLKGAIQFGFNLSRVFQISKKRG
jgi:hypothetical protein